MNHVDPEGIPLPPWALRARKIKLGEISAGRDESMPFSVFIEGAKHLPALVGPNTEQDMAWKALRLLKSVFFSHSIVLSFDTYQRSPARMHSADEESLRASYITGDPEVYRALASFRINQVGEPSSCFQLYLPTGPKSRVIWFDSMALLAGLNSSADTNLLSMLKRIGKETEDYCVQKYKETGGKHAVETIRWQAQRDSFIMLKGHGFREFFA